LLFVGYLLTPMVVFFNAFEFIFSFKTKTQTDAINSYSPYNGSIVHWSERQYRINTFLIENQNQFLFDVGYLFTVYKLKLCGSLLLSNYSTTWQAQINTRMEGIGLPEPYYFMVVSWLRELEGGGGISKWTDEDIQSLPSLSFSLIEDGPMISVPLSALLLKNVHGTRQFHVYNKGPVKYFGRVSIMRAYPTIDLGTRVMQHIYTIFDINTLKVGLVQKIPKQSTTQGIVTNMCKPKPVCRGSQTYYEPMNTCVDPPCYLYYFQTVDSTTKTCKMVCLTI